MKFFRENWTFLVIGWMATHVVNAIERGTTSWQFEVFGLGFVLFAFYGVCKIWELKRKENPVNDDPVIMGVPLSRWPKDEVAHLDGKLSFFCCDLTDKEKEVVWKAAKAARKENGGTR